MLDRTGDTDSHIKLRRHNLTGLTHLQVVGRIARVNRCTGGTNRRAKLVGELFDQGEVFFGSDAAPARDYDACLCQVWSVAFGDLVLDPFGKTGVARRANGFDCCRTAHTGGIKPGRTDR